MNYNNTTSDITAQWKPLPGVDKCCFACGGDNHHGLQMTFETNGERLRSKIEINKRFRGWSNLVHGGVLSTILDETMSWAAIYFCKKLILTMGMRVDFHKPVRVGQKVVAYGFIREQRGKRKVQVGSEIVNEQQEIVASSTGEFALFSEEQFVRMNIIPEADLKAMAPLLRA